MRSKCIPDSYEMQSGHSGRIRSGLLFRFSSNEIRMCGILLKCCVRIFRKQSECCWNALPMPFDISPLRMHLESFEHVQNIPVSHKNVPEYLNAHRMHSELLKCNSIVQECTTKFHSDGILTHSGTSVTGVCLLSSDILIHIAIWPQQIRAEN